MKKWKETNLFKRLVSLSLAVVMAVTMLPMNAFATEGEAAVQEAVSDEVTAVVDGSEEIVSISQQTAEELTGEEYQAQSSLTTVLSFELKERLRQAVYYGGEAFTNLDLTSFVKATVDGKEVEIQDEDLTLTWKKAGEDGTLTALESAAPVDAGTYNLAVELKAREGAYQAAVLEGGVVFIIKPAKLYVYPELEVATTGSKVSDIKLYDVSMYTDTGDRFTYSEDNAETTDVNEADNSDISITYTVREAYDELKAALPADTVLVTNEDYVVDYTISFTEKGKTAAAGNYEIASVEPQVLQLTDLIPTHVYIANENWEDEVIIRKTYTGEAIEAPVRDRDYKVVVSYVSGNDANGDPQYANIEDAPLIEEWYQLQSALEYIDSEGHGDIGWKWVKLESAPVNAGAYVYRLTYEGQEGLYAPSYSDIPVVIDPMKVVIIPSIQSDAVFYDEMTAVDVLSKIDYKVYQADDITKEVKVDRNTVWGTGYSNVYYTQPYEPVFSLEYEEKDEAGNSTYYAGSYYLDSSRTYRVIFSGKKDVSTSNDMEFISLPINAIANTTDMNYYVETDYEEAIVKHAVYPIIVQKGKETSIDITEIIAGIDNKGVSLNDAYTKVYDGEPLYKDKADYKKAVVKSEGTVVAKNTDESLDYEWYVNLNDSVTDAIFSDYTDEPYGEDENGFEDQWGSLGYDIPTEPGIYKLYITYKNPKTPEYLGAWAEVYYVIEKQPVKVAFTGEYKALVGQEIREFMNRFLEEQSETASIQVLMKDTWTSLTEEEEKDFWVTYSVLETMMVEDVDENGNPKLDEEGNPVLVPEKNVLYHYCSYDGKDYEVKDAQGNPVLIENQEEWDRYSRSEFKENATYELTADIYGYSDRYINYKYVIKDYYIQSQNDVQHKLHQVREQEYYNEKVPILIEKMGEEVVSISVNTLELGEDTKVYDGKPFDVEAYLADAVSFKKSDGSDLEVADMTYDYYLKGNVWNQYEQGYIWATGLTEVIDAGSYDVYVSYPGSTEYAAVEPVLAGTVKITPASLTVTPVITSEITGGDEIGNIWNRSTVQKNIQFTGVVERDIDAFTFDSWGHGFVAFTHDIENIDSGDYDWIQFDVYRVDDLENPYYGLAKGDKTYILIGRSELALPYGNNYKLEYEDVSFTAKRSLSTIAEASVYYDFKSEYLTNRVNYDGETSIVLNDKVEGYTHTVIPMNAIPYSYYYNEEGEKISGNLVAVHIDVPAEYEGMIPSTAVYKNAIEAQGGKVFSYSDDGRIGIIFDASAKDKKAFTIRWEEAYSENFIFDFSKAELMGDLSQAVAPKSIAFQKPLTKMAVGEVQNLDLKLTKVQQNDVIYIAYQVSDDTVLSVDQYGTVTALKEGKAVVTAAPAKNINGEQVLIDKAKSTKVTITVKPVTTPKIKKITAIDDSVKVDYGVLTDGYRREIYILEGKNVQAKTFEDKIASMKNGSWQGIFPVAPEFFSPDVEKNNHPYNNGKYDTKTVRIEFYSLDPSTTYTVYVRNVSAIRKADEDSIILLSAQGKTKSFTTSKPHVEGLTAYFKDLEQVNDLYTVDISKGKAKVTVDGLYSAKITNPAMDFTDLKEETLPLKGQAKKLYVNPKLSYAVYEKRFYYNYEIGEYEEYNYMTNKATVDKKGNVKLLGKGTVYVVITDTNTGVSTEVGLKIDAKVDKVKGRNSKLSVGTGIYLEDLLTYYSGKKKVVSGYAGEIEMNETLIKAFETSEHFTLNSDTGYVTAVKEGGKLKITLTEVGIKANGGQANATVTLTSKPLEAVKKLKIANAKNLNLSEAALSHDYAILQFEYTGGAKGFKIEVRDQRGNLIRSSYATRNYLDSYYGNDRKNYYTWDVPNLTQQSKYQVTITALYNDIVAKPAKANIKTTKIPVSTIRLNEYDGDDGLDIFVMNDREYDSIIHNGVIYTQDGEYLTKLFTSGNVYHLGLYGDILAAASGSDSLIWTSSNSKVATIKANTNSPYASLTAVREGETTIEVKSKLTKEVISRRKVTVTSVGDGYAAGRRYYNENTPDYLEVPEFGQSANLEVGVTKHVPLMENAEKLFLFTAPSQGVYRFANARGNGYSIRVYNDLDSGHIGQYDDNGYLYVQLEARETVYIKITSWMSYYITVPLTLSLKECITLSTEKSLHIPSGSSHVKISFTAPADGEYEFSLSGHNGRTLGIYSDMNIWTNKSNGRDSIRKVMKEGETVYLNVAGYSYGSAATFTLNAALVPQNSDNPDNITP